MSINALPQTAIRAIGSSQALTDPSSVIKELIDNAIDAWATSVSIEISANTLDVIQVRDNGHGVAPNDRPLVARRYCTSKIRDEKDLASIGGSSLGFRGEALSSAVEISDSMTITTRVEGEIGATALKISQSGEVMAENHASHPVGTTVRITGFLARHPVRKQVALKSTVKTLAKIKQMLQAYAFARPLIRLSVRVLKAKNGRDDWTYAPKPGSSIEDTALKVVGKPCVSQCAHYTAGLHDFSLDAFVPRQDAVAAKIGSYGQFLSVDGRPVTSARGTPKQIVKIWKDALRRDNDSLQGVKDPFMYLSISCPQNSYDANIEPAKDDVLFVDPEKVLDAVRTMLDEAYPAQESSESTKTSTLRLIQHESSAEPAHEPSQSLAVPVLKSTQYKKSAEKDPIEEGEMTLTEPRLKSVCTVKNNMYDLDADDLALFADGNDDIEKLHEETEPSSSNIAASTNPWIVAKMNASMGKHSIQQQPATPARQADSFQDWTSSPMRGTQPAQQLYLPTPRASSPRMNHREQSPLFVDSRAIGATALPSPHPHLIQSPVPQPYLNVQKSGARDQQFDDEIVYDAESDVLNRPPVQLPQNLQGTRLDQIPEVAPRQRSSRRQPQQQGINKPFKPPMVRGNDIGFTPPVVGRFGPSERRALTQRSPPLNLVQTGEPVETFDQPRFITPPVNNRDIRSFLKSKNNPADGPEDLDQSDDENTLSGENNAPHTRTIKPAALLPSIGDFVPASRLSLDDLAPEDLPRRDPRPRRRRTSEGWELEELTGNGTVDDDSDYTEAINRSRRRRIAHGNKAQRSKSAHLPLERVLVELQVHNVSVATPISTASISLELDRLDMNETFMSFNVGATQCKSVFEQVSDADTMRWSDVLHVLLKKTFRGEMIQDLHDLVRDACTFDTESQSSFVPLV